MGSEVTKNIKAPSHLQPFGGMCLSTGTLSDCRFPDFQRACTRVGGTQTPDSVSTFFKTSWCTGKGGG